MKKFYLLLIALLLVRVTTAQWFLQNPLPQLQDLHSVMFPSSSVGYAVGNWGTIIKTTNGGTNWTVLSSGTGMGFLSVYFTDPDTGYVVGISGTILKTTDGGKNWTTLSTGTTNYLYSVYFP